MTHEGDRLTTARLIVVASVAFGFLHLAAAALYPGGTWFDLHATRYDLGRNYLCDVMQPVALNGASNRVGAGLGVASFLALTAGLFGVWRHLGALVAASAPTLGRVMVRAGTLGCVGLVGVALLPSGVVGRWHALVVFVAVGASLVSLVAARVAVARHVTHARAVRVWMGALAVLVTVDAALYAASIASPRMMTPATPMLQKAIAVAALGWMLAVARVR